MTFAEVEELVGRLPDSARLHRAWWSNNSHVARGLAGHRLAPPVGVTQLKGSPTTTTGGDGSS
jgi:hypothetical protein